MDTITFEIEGLSPLLMHNERLANQLDPATKRMKEITGKKKKTEEDLLALAWAEFEGGLYIDDDVGPYMPGTWIDGTFRDSAKMIRRGTDIKRGLQVVDDRVALLYEGPRDSEKMWAAGMYDQRMVKNQMNKVLRTRPRFNKWKARFQVSFDTGLFDRQTVISILENAGKMIGLGDYRPRFGKFNVKEV
jgi:hypothetical protein